MPGRTSHDRILKIFKLLLFFINESKNGKIIHHFSKKILQASWKASLGFDGLQWVLKTAVMFERNTGDYSVAVDCWAHCLISSLTKCVAMRFYLTFW